ncbi:response regulator [soil metagenome]
MKPDSVHILLADDDPDDRLLTADAFAEARLVNQLHQVNDGVELFEFLHRRPPYVEAPRPGLILLDLNMPRKDGRQVLAELKSDPDLAHIPVVVLTTSAEEEDIVRSYGLGANSYITKPVTWVGLVHAVAVLGQYWFSLVDLPGEAT